MSGIWVMRMRLAVAATLLSVVSVDASAAVGFGATINVTTLNIGSTAGGLGLLTLRSNALLIVESNLTATFLTIKSFLPGMIERRRGAIVTMASNAGRFLDMKLTASYAAAKAGIVMLTRHVALEVGQHGVRVNCVAPATVRSERVDRIMSPERRAEVARMSPLGRMGVPDDVAAATLFLASESASWLTGVTLDVAGGRIML